MANRPTRLPSTGTLRAFEAAARHLNFTRAAEEIGHTQGAVSHQIRLLERGLDARLFDRGPRGLTLTAAGRTYLPYVREALARLREGAVALAPGLRDRVLTVSMSPNFAARWLVPRLGAFNAAHPGLELRISAAADHVTFQGDGIDVAVRHGTGDWPALDVTRLCTERVFPVCSPEFSRRAGTLSEPADLLCVALLHDRDTSAWRAWLREFGVTASARPTAPATVFSQASLALDAASAGQGIALARSALAALDLETGRLLRPIPHERPASFAYWIVCPPALAGSDKVRRFTRWLLDEARAGVEAAVERPGTRGRRREDRG